MLVCIDWKSVPDVISKEQFYKLCHISKSTALYLLSSGTVPCRCSGKATHSYQIKKEDVKKYLHMQIRNLFLICSHILFKRENNS